MGAPALSGTFHLVRRFLGSLRPGGPAAEDERWAIAWLEDGERALWLRMSGPDRRHAVAVARRVAAALGADATRPVLAAALMHDVGKLGAGLGTFGRVAATLAARVGRPALTHRTGLYHAHGEIGADLLAAAGSDPVTCAWAREHHLPSDRWTLPPELASALKAADDD